MSGAAPAGGLLGPSRLRQAAQRASRAIIPAVDALLLAIAAVFALAGADVTGGTAPGPPPVSRPAPIAW